MFEYFIQSAQYISHPLIFHTPGKIVRTQQGAYCCDARRKEENVPSRRGKPGRNRQLS